MLSFRISGLPVATRLLPALLSFGLLQGAPPEPVRPRTLAELAALAPEAINPKDVALANLLCAQGLPGAESIDLNASLQMVETIARKVYHETDRLRPRFWQKPQEFYGSEAYFKMLVLVTVVQQDFKIHYNPARIAAPDKPEPSEVFYADSNDIFIQGALGSRRSGTCASLPVFYTAIGRRLGYPLKLVTAKAHLFARWDDGKEKLNIESSGQGLSVFPDEHYRKWPYPMTPEEEKEGFFLKSLSPAEEIAIFLQARSQVLLAHKKFAEARVATKQAGFFAPHWAHIDGLILRSIDIAQHGPPKPMLLRIEPLRQPRIVGPSAEAMLSATEAIQMGQEARRRYEQRDPLDPTPRPPSPFQPALPRQPTPMPQSMPGMPLHNPSPTIPGYPSLNLP